MADSDSVTPPRRIAFIAHLSEVSGAGVALVDTAVAFQGAGHKVWLVLPGNGDLAGRGRERGLDVIIIENPEVAVTDASLGSRGRLLGARAGYVRQLRQFLIKNCADVAYVNSSASVFAGAAARFSAIPLVWHIHETLDSEDRRTRLKKWIISRLADRLVYASNSAVEHFPVGNIPVLVARNAVDMEALLTVRSHRMLRREGSAGVDERGSHLPLVFLNGTIRRKGADVLLRAVGQLLEKGLMMDVVITGGAETDLEFYGELLELRSALGLEERVTLGGMQPSLVPVFETADVYVSASRNEAMPIAIVEAMAAGVPVIATDVGDCRDLLDDGQCGLVVAAEDVDALADALAQVVGDAAAAGQRAAQAAEKADALYGGPDFWRPLMDFVEGAVRK